MAQLSIYLPPFAGDYSGVCSALFDLNCLIIINDASCCTRNYVNYDEPRWTRTKKTTFCSELRTMNAILGDDERVIRQAVEAADKLGPDFIAVLGSPVPAIIGMDMTGIAYEIEDRSGIPALGFDTTGFSYYNKGVETAFLMLLKRFTLPSTDTIRGSVNILGLTPLDFSANDNSSLFRQLFEDSGIKVISSFLMGTDLNQIRSTSRAEVNLVVSQSGFAAAQYMGQKFGIPYVVGTPVGLEQSQLVIEAVRQTAKDMKNRVVFNDHFMKQPHSGEPAILIIGDQVIANSLRLALRQKGCERPVTTAGFFNMDSDLSLPGDQFLKNEKHLLELLRSGEYDHLIADPFITKMPDAITLKSSLLPHPAVSSNIHWDDVPLFIGHEMESLLTSICR